MRLTLALAAVALLAFPSAHSAPAQEKVADGLKKPDNVKMDEAGKKACAKALEWLAKQQNADGSFSDGGYLHNTAVTSFALLAFMSQGHLPNKGLYGPEVQKGARFLIAAQRKDPDDGYLVGAR